MLCVFGAGACEPAGDASHLAASPSPDSLSPESPSQPEADAELEERLMALGYLDHAEGARGAHAGVVQFDRARASSGYTLTWLPSRPCLAELIDMQGTVVRFWQLEDCKALNRAILLPDGDLLAVGGFTISQYSPEGEKRWERKLRANHDIERSPNGGILTLSADFRNLAGWSRYRVRDTSVVLLSSQGEFVDRVSLFDATIENDIGFELIPRDVKTPRALPKGQELGDDGAERGAQGEPYIDLFHSNKVEWMSRPALLERHPLYGLDNVLVTSRHQNAILAIDFQRKTLVWAWGQGVLSGPHDASVLDSGNLLVFDNGLSTKQSRVLEVDPIRGEVVWQYDGAPDREFFTISRGSAQRLPNGNTLVVISGEGHAREVTRKGDIVWEYWNPHFGKNGGRIGLTRMRRYPADYSGLVGIGGR
jgi:outer membrane protein assembly factor BamB